MPWKWKTLACGVLFVFLAYHGRVTASDGWRVMPIRSQAEFDAGRIGGEAEQHPHSIARCLYDPDVLYLSQDVGQVWKSCDGGDSWKKTPGIGLYQLFGQSIQVDPHNSNLVFLTVAANWNWLAEDFEGLYRSSDAGNTWEFVLPTDVNYSSGLHRIHRSNIAYDLSSTDGSRANVWYAAFPNNGVYRSADAGRTWVKTWDLDGHDRVYQMLVHPTDGQTVYLCTQLGFYISSNQGQSFFKSGNLPGGAVSSIAQNLQNPDELYVTLLFRGLYRSTNAGQSFQLARSFDVSRVFMNPGYPDTLYLVGSSANTITTHDAGQNWITNMTTQPAPGLGRAGSSWKSQISGQLSGIVPNPLDAQEAVAYSRATLWKTTDGGRTFRDSSTLFTGFAWGWWNDAIAFDAADPDVLAFFNFDVGMTITSNGGDWFSRRNDNAGSWLSQGLISWLGTYAGDICPDSNVQIILAAIGGQFSNRLMRTGNGGITWELVTAAEDHNHLFIAFHPEDPNIVVAGDKVSTNKGQSFSDINFGAFQPESPTVLGYCIAQPDTLYAMSSDRRKIYRSDNRGASWTLYTNPGWRFNRLDSLPTFAVDPVDPDVIYTLDTSFDLAVYDGQTWRSTGVLNLAGGIAQGNHVRSVAVDPRYPDILYAGLFAPGIDCMWRSTDKGLTWVNITYNLPRVGVTGLAVSPHTGEVFRGSPVGTWVFPPPYDSENRIYERLVSMPLDQSFTMSNLAGLAARWQQVGCGTCDLFDLDFDGSVGISDLLEFARGWLNITLCAAQETNTAP